MKNTFLAMLLISLAVLPLARNAFAQDSPQWHLPEGATARLGKGSINEIAYSPDGTRLAVASRIGIWMYNTQTGEPLDLLAPNTGVNSMSFSPDGKILATVNGSFRVHLWHATTGERLQTIRGVGRSNYLFMTDNVVFSPDGNTLAVGSRSNALFLLDVNTGKQLHTLIESGFSNGIKPSISFSPDGKILASHIWVYVDGEAKRYLFLWDVNTGEKLLQILTEGELSFTVSSISFSPDGSTLATGSGDEIRFWDVNTGETLQILTEHTSVKSISFSPDGSTLATGSGDEIHFWDVNTGETLQTLTGHTGVKSISFSPDGSTLATGSGDEIHFWDVNTGETLQILTEHTFSVSSISFSPDGSTLATGSGDEVRFWDVNTGETLQTLTGHTGVKSISFSPDGSTLAAVTGDFYSTVLLWDVNTGELRTFTTRSPNSVAFSPDGNIIAIGGNWRTDILNANTGAPIHTFSKIACRVESVAFSPDGKTLAGGGSDGIVRLWDIKTGTERQIPTGYYGGLKVAFSPDGNTLATVPLPHIGGQVRLWDVNTGKQLQEFTADGSGLVRIYSMAFSPDGNTLATGSGDYDHIEGSFGTVTLWDVNTGETLQTLTGHAHKVSSISFSPDGSTLATGGGGAVLLWELTPFSPEPERITADINADGTVNIQDLVLVASNLGKTGENPADVNGDGIVNILDLVAVADQFGP